MNNFRYATINDSSLVFDFIKQLAIYEKMEDLVFGSVELIEKWVFKEKKAEVIFILEDNKEIGFALYFYNFSTFLTKPGIYLEDIFIKEKYRNKGYGKLVFEFLINKAKEENLGRIEWVCLDWNEPSIKFYEKLGAKPLNDWIIFRLDDKAIIDFKWVEITQII